MSEATTIFICGVCGRTDRWNPFTGKTHWSKGERCGGKPIAVEYVPAARIAELERLLAERDQALRGCVPWVATSGRGAAQEALAVACELTGQDPYDWSAHPDVLTRRRELLGLPDRRAAVSEKDAP